MNRAQKMACLFIITTLVGVIISCVVSAVLYFKVGMPKALLGFSCVGIGGLGAIGTLIFKKDKGKVAFDERDRLIHQRASWAGFGTAYMVMGLWCMIPFFVLGPKADISVTWLPHIFIFGGICHYFAHSVAILAQYGREEESHE